MYRILFLLLLPALLFSKFQVTTHFPLETFFVKQIGQSHIRIKEITNLYTEDLIELTVSQRNSLARVKVFFHFGFDVELQYARVFKEINPKLLVVDMSKGVKKHSFNGKINHNIWMDPLLLRDVAKNIYEALVLTDKFNKSNFEYNYNRLLDKLDELFLETKRSLDASEIYNILIYDENWYYYLNRFRLNIYRKEKRFIKAKELSSVSKFINKNYIKALLIKPNDSYLIAKSLVGNSDVKIITHDIYDKVYFFNMSKLKKELSN